MYVWADRDALAFAEPDTIVTLYGRSQAAVHCAATVLTPTASYPPLQLLEVECLWQG